MNQTTENFLQIEAIFNEALGVPEDLRKELIEARCNGYRELIAEVSSLLKASEDERNLTACCRLEPETGRENNAESKCVGPYVLDRLLGRGGMGAVYLAHRADGQFEQKVAIKLIDLPLATDLFRERFRKERQILAGLQHPYIARLLDGGVTQNGDLFLVMEYVDGLPIHRFCDERHLSPHQRLTLFMRVCEAVQFAHQHFIVHRDLKPDNLLVAQDGTPRLLDFGTAKLLSPSAGEPGGQLTREGFQSFTPQFASPEQVLGNPITTASDTYSLGVLLYVLLTGMPPYELKQITTAEMLRVICEEPPHRPSHAAGAERRLDSDLDAILLKALRKEPQERYVTVEQLSGDVGAYLDGRPVAARQGTLRYRATKFIRRNWFSLAAAALLAVTLVAGVVGVAWQAKVANEERHKADARSVDLRQLSNSLMSELNEAIKQLPGSTGAQKLLVTRVLEHLDRMASDANGDRLTQLDLIDAYTKLGEIQGNPYSQNLGDPAGGLVSLDKAISLASRLAPEGSKDREALHALASAHGARSAILFGTGRTHDAIVSARSAIRIADWLVASPDATPALICEAASVYNTLGDELGQGGPASLNYLADALGTYRNDARLAHRALSLDPGSVEAVRILGIAQLKIGEIELETDPSQALKSFQTILQWTDALPKTEQNSLQMVRGRASLLENEAVALVQLQEFSRSIEIFHEAARIDQRLAAGDPQDWRALADLEDINNQEAAAFEAAADPALAVVPSERRRNLAAAEKLLIQVVSMMDRAVKRDPGNEGWKAIQADAQVRLGTIQSILRSSGAPGELARTGIASFRLLTKRDQASPIILNTAAKAFLKVEPDVLRDPQLAVACAERAVALSHRQTPSMLLTLAQAYCASGQIEKCKAMAHEGLALLPVLQPGSVKPNIRRLLEILAQSGR